MCLIYMYIYIRVHLYLQLYLWASTCIFLLLFFRPGLLFQIHGASGHVGTTSRKLELLGEGAWGSCHHGLRSFSPCLMRSTVPTVQAGNEIWHVTAHAAVVSSTAWAAGRLFSVTRAQLSKGFWSNLQKPQKNTILERFGFYMWICWFALCSSFLNMFFRCRMVLKRIQLPHISMGQAGDKFNLKHSTTTTRRELLVDRSGATSAEQKGIANYLVKLKRPHTTWSPKM